MVPEIEEFAKGLVECVRDAAIQSNDMELGPTTVSPVGRRWRQAGLSESNKDLVHVVIPDAVDEAVFYLLKAIDDGILRLQYTATNGKTVDLAIDGREELGGWYMGSGGWRALYSKERFVDDFADLTSDK